MTLVSLNKLKIMLEKQKNLTEETDMKLSFNTINIHSIIMITVCKKYIKTIPLD